MEPQTSPPLDRHLRGPLWRRLLGFVGVALFAEVAYGVIVVVALPLYLANTLHWRVSLIGPIASAFLLAEMLGKLALAPLSDYIGRKPLILVGLAISGLAVMGMMRETNYWLFVALAAMNGLGGAALWPNVWAGVADVTTEPERVGSMSVFNMMNMVGLGAAPIVASLIQRYADKHSKPPNLIFPVTAGLFLIAWICAVLLIPLFRRPVRHEAEEAESHGHFRIMYATLAFFLVLSFLQTLGLQIMSGSIVIYLNRDLGLTQDKIGLPFAVLGVLILSVAIPIGALGGVWGRVRSVRLGLFMSALGMALLPGRPSIYWFLAIGMPMIVGMLFAIPAWMAIITELAPESWRGRVFGYVSTAQSAGAVLGPSVGTWLFDHTGHASPFYASGAVLGIALITAMFGLHEGMRAVTEKPRRRRQRPAAGPLPG